jgi:rare lipoprotein A
VSRRRNAYAVITLLCGALALPASGWASSGAGGSGGGGSGGSGLGPPASGNSGNSGNSGTSSAPTTATTQNGNVTVSTSGGGITVQARASTMLRKGLTFSGSAPSSDAGKTIEIERSGHQTNWQWAATATATVASNGTFQASWATNHIGRFSIRAVLSAPGLAQSASAAAQPASATPSMVVTVFLNAIASWYGPTGRSSRTACGQKLTRTTIGVANKTLRCGTQVALYYRGRTMIVPVIDHGPYVKGRSWDLTEATAKALGFNGVGAIGAVSLPTP